MKQNLRFIFMTLLCAVFSTAWGQEVTLDLTDASWNFPTSSKVIQATSYTNSDGYTIIVEGTEGNGFRYYTNNGNYFLFGKQGASITLPEFDFDVEKIEIVGTNGASPDVRVNIFVGNTAVSTETKGLKEVTQSYDIAPDYQEAGNIYVIKVTSAHNAQASAIKIYKKESGSTVATPTFSPATGTIFYGSQTVTISTKTQDAAIYYTTNGDVPSTSCTQYTAPFSISATTTIKAIAVKEGMTNSPVADATYTKGTPFISVASPNINVVSAGGDGTIDVTYGGIVESDLIVCDADGISATYDWLEAELNSDNDIDYLVGENTSSSPRTAYLKVYGLDSETNDVYSDLITITQEAYVEPASAKTYQKVTSTDDITDGNYLIVYEGDNSHASVAFNGKLETLDGANNTVEVTINDEVIEDSNDAYFTIDVTNGTIKSASGKFIGVSSNSNGLKQTDDAETYKNSFAIGENGDAVISAVFEGSTMAIRYNYASDNLRFRYYKSGQQPIALYKEVDEIVRVPSIEVNPKEVNVDADGGEGTIIVTYKNFGETEIEANVKFYAENEEEASYDWITATVNSDNNVAFTVLANNGDVRTAYLKVFAKDGKGDNVYSKMITIIQEKYVIDYAEIPFEFNGGKDDIENTNGLAQTGLGSDYSSTTAPNTKLKFDGTNDELILKLEEHAEDALSLAFDIKGNSFSGGTFTVQISEDGETYENLETYTELGDEQTEVFNLSKDIRYIKWVYTEKVNGNVGLGNIVVIIPEDIKVTFVKKAEGYSTLYYGTKSLNIPEGVKAYTYKVNEKGAAVETEYESIIPQGSAVIVELTDKSVLESANSYDVTFTTTASKGSIHKDNMLNGFDEEGNETTGPDPEKNYYFYSLSLNKNSEEGSIGFYWKNSDGSAFTLPAHRAYLAVEQDLAGASAFAFDGFSTNISGIKDQTATSEGVYTISGVRVNSDRLPKGVYIVKGKKVIIK